MTKNSLNFKMQKAKANVECVQIWRTSNMFADHTDLKLSTRHLCFMKQNSIFIAFNMHMAQYAISSHTIPFLFISLTITTVKTIIFIK